MTNEPHMVELFDSEIDPFMTAVHDYNEELKKAEMSGDFSAALYARSNEFADMRLKVLLAANHIYDALRKQLQKKDGTK